MYLATLSLFIYIFTKISADLYAGSLFLTLSIPELNIYLAVIILLAITVVYAIAGGLKVLGCSFYNAPDGGLTKVIVLTPLNRQLYTSKRYKQL